ncbi:MAG TPA: lipid II flippase MurJ [Streptosporangiaceae bacterium]|nr:lipid II flippase MurJ [Streptosporangiaceae bacterium]
MIGPPGTAGPTDPIESIGPPASGAAQPAGDGVGGVRPPGASRAAGFGRAALLIGGLTVVARILGFARTLVFADTVKTSCLSAAYVTANQVPNVIYDIVLGGALTAIVIPILAGPVDRVGNATVAADSRAAASGEVRAISSALLTWTVVILAPVSLGLALAAGPAISALMPVNPGSGCARSALVPIATRMLVVFAPQILLYGLAVVMYGILQSHKRFFAPAFAPVLSSIVVIVAYAVFVPLGGSYTTHVAGLPFAAEFALSGGTTLGVAALMLTAIWPVWRLRLRLRPTFLFPEGIARRARSLAGVGVAALIAQDASVLVVTWLANKYGSGDGSAVTVYSYSWQAFVSIYAVLAIPIAISAFPVLSARQGVEFDTAAASATRATVLASWLGAALLTGVAFPIARAFPALSPVVGNQFALALVAFAPGLVGYGLTACLARVLFADGRNRAAAIALVAGWLVVIAADVVVVPLVPARSVVPVLGLANTIGMTASGIALLVAVARARGRAALHGSWRATGAGLAAAVAGAAVGLGLTAAVPVTGHWLNAGLAVGAGVGVLAVFGAVVALLDGGDLRNVVARMRRRAAS